MGHRTRNVGEGRKKKASERKPAGMPSREEENSCTKRGNTTKKKSKTKRRPLIKKRRVPEKICERKKHRCLERSKGGRAKAMQKEEKAGPRRTKCVRKKKN